VKGTGEGTLARTSFALYEQRRQQGDQWGAQAREL